MYAPTFHVEGSSRYEDMGILKINICASSENSVTVWRELDVYVGEPLFVPDPLGSTEDDGVLLVVSKDATKKASKLLVIDAKSMTKVAEVNAPFPLMFEFHGKFFPSKF
jgi:carotenoid cleavage dioxygenase-like enzyme